MIVPVLLWVGIVGVLGCVGWVMYRVAAGVDRAARQQEEWDVYVGEMWGIDPGVARELEWMYEQGLEEEYVRWSLDERRRLWR